MMPVLHSPVQRQTCATLLFLAEIWSLSSLVIVDSGWRFYLQLERKVEDPFLGVNRYWLELIFLGVCYCIAKHVSKVQTEIGDLHLHSFGLCSGQPSPEFWSELPLSPILYVPFLGKFNKCSPETGFTIPLISIALHSVVFSVVNNTVVTNYILKHY